MVIIVICGAVGNAHAQFNNNLLMQRFCLQGWVKAVRKQKDIVFLDLNDGSTPHNLQIIAATEEFPRYA